MAKIVGIIGTGSGRLGNAVLSKGDNGQTNARTYQSQVRNPRTIDQRKQRAKMNLAGQISKLVPASALVGFHQGSNRNNRSAFVSSLLNACTVATDSNGDYQATLVPDKVRFAFGTTPLMYGDWSNNRYTEKAMELSTFGNSYVGTNVFMFSATYLIGPLNYGATMDEILQALFPKGIYGEMFTCIGLSDIDGTIDFVVNVPLLLYGTPLKPSYVYDMPMFTRDYTTGLPMVNGQKILWYRTPFLLGENASAFISDDASISGNNIVATSKSPLNIGEIMEEYRRYDNVPTEVVRQLCQSPSTKWGNTHFLGVKIYQR